MTGPTSQAARSAVVERLVGDTGEPDQVVAAARALAERVAPAIAETLKTTLAAAVTVDVEGVELVRFSEARPARATGHLMAVAASSSSPDALVLVLDPAAIALAVGVLFGADPDAPFDPIDRELSPTEIEVAGMVVAEIARAVNGSGSRSLDLKLPLPPPITGAELRKHVLRDGPAVRMTFALATPAGSGSLFLVMPQRVLLKHRGDAVATGGSPPGEDWRARFSEEVMRSAVTLEATMPLGRLTLGDIAMMELGQVIELQAGAQAETRLAARGRTLFVCEFGRLGQNYTVRISQPFDESQELIDGILPAEPAGAARAKGGERA